MSAPDPFEALRSPTGTRAPDPAFARRLRARLVAALDLPARPEPDEETPMTTTPNAGTPAPTATAVTPYLTATDATAALDWYVEAFGAVEQFRVVGDDGRLGHAEFEVGAARFMLSDEYPEMGVVPPTTLGGSATALHVEVADVDVLFRRAVAAGATAQAEPEDQPHGARHGTLVDPYGHRWMLSQSTEAFDLDTYARRSEGSASTVEAGPAAGPARQDDGGIWASAYYTDARAGIRFLIEVRGFTEQLVVTGEDPDTVVHSELRWPEGGIVSPGTYNPDNPFVRSLAPGAQSLYVITADPHAVHQRCVAAGVEVLREPEEPPYDPGGMAFAVRDPEGNIWSFGTYAGSG